MALTAGARLGVYEIVAPLGAGGMGEVYRARDTRLGRDVAIKVLPPDVASDSERLARFEREAQVLASLNHPNIAHIHGVEESTGTLALVMELVDGPTLADRTAKGPLPVDEALAIARQIAEGLEAAHEQGIVHRDLKPANIKVRDDGTVKVLDFGLAKAFESTQAAALNATQSPTITTPAIVTGVGIILGTAAYMSPEQVKGRPADKRSDVWAFGCVLYEMLTGARAFDGEDVSDTLANVLKTEPDWNALPAEYPGIQVLLRRCLEKDKRQRLGDIAGALLVLREPRVLASIPPSSAITPQRNSLQRVLPIALAAVAAAAIAIVVDRAVRTVAPPRAQVSRFSFSLPEGQRFPAGGGQVLAISPDGTHIAYVASGRLYLRSLSELEARPVSGLEDTSISDLTFSGDGRSIVFVTVDVAAASVALKRVPLSGGTAVTVHETRALNYFGGLRGQPSSAAGVLFVQPGNGIVRVPENGGAAEVLVSIKDDLPSGPQLLPGGDALLFTLAKGITGPVGAPSDVWDRAEIVVHDLKTGARTKVWEGGDALYSPTGHILYAVSGSLLAVPFDAVKRKVTGPAVPMIEGVARPIMPGAAPSTVHFGVSNTGTLAYIPGPRTASSQRLDLGLSDQQGRVQRLNLTPGAYQFPRVSPDGRYVAVETEDAKNAHVWVHEVAGRSMMRQLTLEGRNRFPVWSGDSRQIAFQSDRGGDLAIFAQRADGSLRAERLTKPAQGLAHVPQSWSRDGRTLLFSEVKADQYSLWALSLPDGKVSRVGEIRSTLDPVTATFSPDARWIAYLSSDGVRRLMLEPFPPTGVRYPIATNGWHPLWSPDGRSLFYRVGGDREVMVDITTTPSVTIGNPRPVSTGGWRSRGRLEREYDIMPDGRFIGAIPVGAGNGPNASQQINVVLNWFDELNARAPAK